MRTTWRTDHPGQVLDLLEERLVGAEDVTAVERDGDVLVVRSRSVPTWAYLFSTVLNQWPFKSMLMRARTDNVLRISQNHDGEGRGLVLDGDANAAVSKVLVMTKNELFPPKP